MREPRPGVLGLLPLLALALLVGLAPLGTALLDSFHHDVYGERAPAGLDNYRLLLSDRGLGLSLLITLLWSAAHVALCLALALPVALRIAARGRAGRALSLALLVPWAMPPYIAAALWRALVHGGWGSSLASAILGVRVDLLTSLPWAFGATLVASVWSSFPAATFLILAATSAAPASLLDAARVDGASELGLDRWVRLPAAIGAAGAAAALDFLRAFREVTVILVMTRGGPPLRAGITERGIVGGTTTVELYLYDLFVRTPDMGLAAAGALLVALPIVGLLALYLLLGRPRRTRVLRRARRHGTRGLRGFLPGWSALSVLAALFLLGSSVLLLYALVRLSLSGLSAVYFDSFLPRYPTLASYGAVLGEEGLLRSLGNSLLLSLPVALAAPAVSLPAAAALWGRAGAARRREGRGAAATVSGIQLLGLVTGMHAIVPLYALFRRLGLIGSMLPVGVIYTAHALPFALLSLRAFFRSLPDSLADAARAEGMGERGYLARVLLPLAVPTLAVIGAVAFLGAWNGFLVPLVFLTDDARYPVGVKLFSLIGSVGSANPRWNLFAAGSAVNLLVVGGVTLALRRPMQQSALAEMGE